MGTALIPLAQATPDTIAVLNNLGQCYYGSGMMKLKNLDQGYFIAWQCWQENLTAIEWLRTYHLINDVPAMKAHAMLARFRQEGGDHEFLECTPDVATIKLITKTGRESVISLKWDDLKNEPFVFEKDKKTLKDNYATPFARSNMLWARLISMALRRVAPEIVYGIYTPEEVMDMGYDPGPVKVSGASLSQEQLTALRGEQKSLPEQGVVLQGEVVQTSVFVEDVPVVVKPFLDAPAAVAETPETKAADFKADCEAIAKQAETGPERAPKEMIERLYKAYSDAGLTEQHIRVSCNKRGVNRFEEMTIDQASECLATLNKWQEQVRAKESGT